MTKLLNRARNGDLGARNQLLTDLQRYLSFIANHQFDQNLQAKMGASDIVQQSMIRAVDNLDMFRGETLEEFRGWLRQILINEARQMKRDLRAQKRNVDREQRLPGSESQANEGKHFIDGLPTPGTNAALKEQTAAIHQTLASLPEQDRQIIQWRNWDELSFDEIAKRLNTSISSASRKWYQALVAFKELFNDDRSQNE